MPPTNRKTSMNSWPIDAWNRGGPLLHFGMFVRSIIVHDQVQVETGRSFTVYFFEEADKLLMPMARQTVADNRTVEHAEGRE